MSQRTLKRRRIDHGLPIGADVYSICDDDKLDKAVQEILQESPESGEVCIDGALASQGFCV